MDAYLLGLTLIGLAALSMAWIPELIRKIGISYSIVYLLFGVIIYSLFDILPWPDPLWEEDFTVHYTELVIIIALTATGLKIDRPFSFRRWNIPFRLIFITMTISIFAVTALGIWGFGFDLASAMLLGAVLAPTDPVLAADVQVEPPHEGVDDDVRFALTAEAGLNDGMAFPFTWLAIVLAASSQTGDPALLQWLGMDVVYRILAGTLVGLGMGRLLAFMFFRLPEKLELFAVRAGFVAISSTLLVYGITELLQGYGFVAVFVMAVTFKNYHMAHEYHEELHHFSDQVERILLAVLLILFGGSLISGILNELSWIMVLWGMAFVFLIRPLTGLLGLVGTHLRLKEKGAISFFGIKGVGSFFYLAFAIDKANFLYEAEVWAFTAFVVLVSILVHGLTASLAMEKLNLRSATGSEPKEEQNKSFSG